MHFIFEGSLLRTRLTYVEKVHFGRVTGKKEKNATLYDLIYCIVGKFQNYFNDVNGWRNP